MARKRVSTTVDENLLAEARASHSGGTDAELFDAVLRALLARYREAGIDADYERAYGQQPIDTPDEWGDLASFRAAVSG